MVASGTTEQKASRQEESQLAAPSTKKLKTFSGVPKRHQGLKQSSSGSSAGGNHQDKRYTGSEGQQRCMATTTRGRECAFVSVEGSNYCHLHADYDRNPPPRRGGAKRPKAHQPPRSNEVKMGADMSIRSSELDEEVLESPRRRNSAPGSHSDKKRSKSAKLAKKHAESPFPVLSMISTDQWMEKSVKIAVGPLEGRVGKVEKWSNGWVSVRVPGVGLHNRRSFELCLLQTDAQESSPDKLDSRGQSRSHSLLRCVSREDPSPSVPPRLTKKTKISPTHQNSQPRRDASIGRIKPPITPDSLSPAVDLLQAPETPIPTTKLIADQNADLLPKVTPEPFKDTTRHIPLVGSLLMTPTDDTRGGLLENSSLKIAGRR